MKIPMSRDIQLISTDLETVIFKAACAYSNILQWLPEPTLLSAFHTNGSEVKWGVESVNYFINLKISTQGNINLHRRMVHQQICSLYRKIRQCNKYIEQLKQLPPCWLGTPQLTQL